MGGGTKTELDLRLSAGGGNGPHSHAFAETFVVTEGQLMVQVGKDSLCLKTGDTITAPPLKAHRLSSTDAAARFTITMTPDHEGFEKSLAITYGLARDGKVSKCGVRHGFRNISILFTLADTQIPELLRLLGGVFRWIAGGARPKRVEADLVEAYCG